MPSCKNWPEDSLDAHIRDFLSYIGSEKGVSPNTLKAYGHDVNAFACFLRDRNIGSFEGVEAELFELFLRHLQTQEYASSSICRTLFALKVLFRFLKRENLIKVNILHYIESPKLWQLIPEILSIDEMQRLLNVPDTTTFAGARDRAILEVLYSSGLRVSELCQLSIYDIDDLFVKVMGKGRKERLVPIGKHALNAVDHYLTHFRAAFESEHNQRLFLTNRGKPVNRSLVWDMVKKRAAAAGIEKNISPHTLRHTFATHLLDNGADLRVIQEMLGHASIGSTDRYTHMSRSHLQQAFKQCHPNYSGS